MLLKGKVISDKIVAGILEKDLPKMTLAVFHPANDGAADSYLKTKEKWLKKINSDIRIYSVSESVSESSFFEQLEAANSDPDVTGIMVELPLPIKVDAEALHTKISPFKDVDGVTYLNQGTFFSSGNERLVPCTSLAAIRMLEHYEIPISGRNVVVIGRSYIVGLPLFKLFLNRNATPTVTHRKTANLPELLAKADIVAISAGTRGIIASSQVRDGATVLDIGIHVLEDGSVAGDMILDGENEAERINYTPVPGGVGVVTNAVMLENLVKCYEMQK